MASPDLDQRVHAALDLLTAGDLAGSPLLAHPDASRDPGALGAGSSLRLGVAISGGSDSTALLLLAHDWANSRSAHLSAATVDHGLRPEAADEARAVAALCASLNIPHRTLVWRPAGAVTQAEARNARHRLLAEWARGQGLAALALGHTRDDRIETFLIRARAGSGWWGLAGPMPSAPSPAWPEGEGVRLIRPLLGASRDDLRHALRARDTHWIDDPSNHQPKHERIRMRRLAVRLLPEAHVHTIAIMDRLAQLRAAVLAEARSSLPGIALEARTATIPKEVLERLSAEARFRLVEALVLAAGGSPDRPAPEALRAALSAPQGGNLAGAWLRAGKAGLRVEPEPPRRGRQPAIPGWDRASALLADPRIGVLAF